MTAADVALGLAIDDMLHAVYHVRRRRRERKEARGWNDWVAARTELWRATVGGSLIVSIGFSLLFLSAFPPTRRLGLAVVLGTPDLDDPGARRLPAVGVHVRSHRKTALSGPGRLRAVQEARKEGYVGTLEEVVV